MSSDELSDQLDFLKTIDALKGIVRASPILDRSRCENSAEHSWHLAMYALILADHASGRINVGRVIQMLLIHDIVEIDVGDTPIHGEHGKDEQAELERRAAERIFGLLPAKQANDLLTLWGEFEAAATDDAKFAKSLDRLQPLIHNVETAGGTWNAHKLTLQQVLDRYGPQIENGSTTLWAKARNMVSNFFKGNRT